MWKHPRNNWLRRCHIPVQTLPAPDVDESKNSDNDVSIHSQRIGAVIQQRSSVKSATIYYIIISPLIITSEIQVILGQL